MNLNPPALWLLFCFQQHFFQKNIIVCNMGFNHHTAHLICNEMGFPRARKFTTRYQYHMENHVRDKTYPYHIGQIIWLISYESYDMTELIWPISYWQIFSLTWFSIWYWYLVVNFLARGKPISLQIKWAVWWLKPILQTIIKFLEYLGVEMPKIRLFTG